MPTKRAKRIEMAQRWRLLINEKATAWEIPQRFVTQLNEAVAAVETENALSPSKRNKITNNRLRTAINNLMTTMRDIKKRYFYTPPLSVADIASLGLKPRDTTPTNIEIPTVRAMGRVVYKGAGHIELHMMPGGDISGNLLSYYGIKIAYEVVDIMAAAPQSIRDLNESRFTRRKKEGFVFQPENSGKRIYFSIRYENSKGDAGPWCPIFSALIP